MKICVHGHEFCKEGNSCTSVKISYQEDCCEANHNNNSQKDSEQRVSIKSTITEANSNSEKHHAKPPLQLSDDPDDDPDDMTHDDPYHIESDKNQKSEPLPNWCWACCLNKPERLRQ